MSCRRIPRRRKPRSVTSCHPAKRPVKSSDRSSKSTGAISIHRVCHLCPPRVDTRRRPPLGLAEDPPQTRFRRAPFGPAGGRLLAPDSRIRSCDGCEFHTHTFKPLPPQYSANQRPSWESGFGLFLRCCVGSSTSDVRADLALSFLGLIDWADPYHDPFERNSCRWRPSNSRMSSFGSIRWQNSSVRRFRPDVSLPRQGAFSAHSHLSGVLPVLAPQLRDRRRYDTVAEVNGTLQRWETALI